MLRKHKLFDQTLWISTILACSTGLFCITVSGFFSFINVFVTPIQVISGPIGMYLWNSLAGIYHKKYDFTTDWLFKSYETRNFLRFGAHILRQRVLLVHQQKPANQRGARKRLDVNKPRQTRLVLLHPIRLRSAHIRQHRRHLFHGSFEAIICASSQH